MRAGQRQGEREGGREGGREGARKEGAMQEVRMGVRVQRIERGGREREILTRACV